MKVPLSLFISITLVGTLCAQETMFQDDFKEKPDPGWSWIREHREAWRVTGHGLEVRIEPGNMWGPENSARNLLVRTAPDLTETEIEILVNVENKPSHQYEQVDLVWYFDDSNMVKLGQELVDGKLSVVMGREENDKTRTIAIVPLNSTSVSLRMIVKVGQVRGEFKTPDTKEWHAVGECEPPTSANAKAKISLQFYQGSADTEHWARVTDFRIRKRNEKSSTQNVK
jgi:regulation of enolase protein 1 (concanavalin A-like superfamily)